MRKGIHPDYYQAKVVCNCGNEFVTGSTKEEIHVEICSKCHSFDGTEDGLMFYRKITEKAREYLKTDGYLCYEIGAEQAADVSEIMKQAGLRDITVVKDLAGLDRVVMGRK